MIEENYQIEEMVEQAPLFVIYSAIQKDSGKQCLIKRYVTDDSSEIGRVEGWTEMFTQIVSDFRNVNIPGVRTIIDGGLDPHDGKACTVFEWFEQSSLREQMYDRTSLGMEITLDIARCGLEALLTLHSNGMLQAKLSPDDLFYTNAEHKSPWVFTWDPIRALRCTHRVNPFQNDGYTAPEVLRGADASFQSDLYALGKTIAVAAGELAEDPALYAWLTAMTSEDPQQRFADAQQALDALDAMLVTPAVDEPTVAAVSAPAVAAATAAAPAFAGLSDDLVQEEDVAAEPVAVSPVVPLESHKSKSPALPIAIVALLLLAGGIYFLMSSGEEEEGFRIVSEEEVDAMDRADKKAKKKQKAKQAKVQQQKAQRQAEKASAQQAKSVESDEGDSSNVSDNQEIANTPEASGAQVVLRYNDLKIAKNHFGEEIGLEGVLKDIILTKGEEQYVLTWTPAQARKGTICATANPKSFYPELKLSDLREKFLDKKVLGQGVLIENAHTYSIHLKDSTAFRIIE